MFYLLLSSFAPYGPNQSIWPDKFGTTAASFVTAAGVGHFVRGKLPEINPEFVCKAGLLTASLSFLCGVLADIGYAYKRGAIADSFKSSPEMSIVRSIVVGVVLLAWVGCNVYAMKQLGKNVSALCGGSAAAGFALWHTQYMMGGKAETKESSEDSAETDSSSSSEPGVVSSQGSVVETGAGSSLEFPYITLPFLLNKNGRFLELRNDPSAQMPSRMKSVIHWFAKEFRAGKRGKDLRYPAAAYLDELATLVCREAWKGRVVKVPETCDGLDECDQELLNLTQLGLGHGTLRARSADLQRQYDVSPSEYRFAVIGDAASPNYTYIIARATDHRGGQYENNFDPDKPGYYYAPNNPINHNSHTTHKALLYILRKKPDGSYQRIDPVRTVCLWGEGRKDKTDRVRLYPMPPGVHGYQMKLDGDFPDEWYDHFLTPDHHIMTRYGSILGDVGRFSPDLSHFEPPPARG